jgi:hypothetical protein
MADSIPVIGLSVFFPSLLLCVGFVSLVVAAAAAVVVVSSSRGGGGRGASTPILPLVFSKAENLCKSVEGGAINRQTLAFFPNTFGKSCQSFCGFEPNSAFMNG